MKTTLYMAMTVNGFIAKNNDDTSFVSNVEWESFRKMVKSVGNLIIGSRTYTIMQKNKDFDELRNIRVIVVSDDAETDTTADKHSTAKNPQDALAILKKEGFETALIGGGGTLNASFMKDNLIDEIYLDIEPIIFGKGIKLFEENDFEAKLNLLGTKKLSSNEIQLHYQVLK